MNDSDKTTQKNIFAAIQMASGPNISANLTEAERLVTDAAAAGAQCILLPENFAFMGQKDSDVLKHIEKPCNGQIQKSVASMAKNTGAWVIAGSVPLESKEKNIYRQACLVFNQDGEQVARYDKMHLFDVSIQESGEKYQESAFISAGEETVTVDSPHGQLGLSICYDLRFPELYRQLVGKGMQVALIPSAFTRVTGQAHWESLVRARAIENLSYVVAACQGGYHIGGRETYGHSMIVDPWGNVLDQLENGSGFVKAEIQLDVLETLRKTFPVIEHRRLS